MEIQSRKVKQLLELYQLGRDKKKEIQLRLIFLIQF